MLSDKKKKALVTLLDDPDENIYQVIKQVIKSEKEQFVELLESETFQFDDSLKSERAQDLLSEIRQDILIKELEDWKSSSDKDLLKGIITLSKFQNPYLDVEALLKSIENIRRNIWLEFNDNQTAFEQVNIMNHLFFKVLGYECVSVSKKKPTAFDLESILQNKQGNALTLGLLYSVVAQSLDLPIFGIDLPGAFVLAHMDENHSMLLGSQDLAFGVLFYLDPTDQGKFLDANEILKFLDLHDIKPHRTYFEPTSNTQLLKRLLTEFEYALKMRGDLKKMEALSLLKEVL